MVDTDRSGRDNEVQHTEDRVEGVVEEVEEFVRLVPQEFVVNHVGMDSSPVDHRDEHGQVAGDRLHCPGHLQEIIQQLQTQAFQALVKPRSLSNLFLKKKRVLRYF